MQERQLRILQVEDEEPDAQLFAVALEEAHLDIFLHTVFDAQGGIDYLTGRGPYGDRSRFPLPDLILLDLRMSKLSGADFLKWCRASETCRHLPVALFTGAHQDDREFQNALRHGANRIFTKPVCFHDLVQTAREIYEFGIAAARNTTRPAAWA